MSEIPPDVLRGLNEGRLQAITLVEWLAIDQVELLGHVVHAVGLDEKAEEILQGARELASEGIMRRVRGIGERLAAAMRGARRSRAAFERLASHASDMARAWASYALEADPSLELEERLRAARRFAADPSAAVRECAWDAIRSHVTKDLRRGLRLLRAWARDPDPNVRRTAIEATRPRGVWCVHIEALKSDPDPALILLEEVRADPSDYVRRSAANWLNDASKSRPDWVRDVCRRWLRESPALETAKIVKHAFRTLRKRPAGWRKSR